MKTLIYLFFTMTFVVGCHDKEETAVQLTAPTFDQKSVENKIVKITERYFESYKTMNVDALDQLLTDDCITTGTDPSEVWNKKLFLQKIKELKANPNSVEFMKNLNFGLIERKVHVSENGVHATVTDHSKVNFSKKVIKRITMLKKIGNNWKINAINTALVE